ncbi:hypothetical protein Cst_c15220 [Thermoclostridium stercorarium subsp. stercorarium DSM 8532]|uniref:Uncharacterized protein n=1 Tax=Thermoclostridium stercorarium (strain ATCC 35414 / DSM 8532 / NCIMB 11754) TaxID=1121335 RepID=L7VPA7_THES1|nr:hypothetical protein Cst_c15220 [Thermoclostridium stercorarium subsp. stercorarium DSM 8532]
MGGEPIEKKYQNGMGTVGGDSACGCVQGGGESVGGKDWGGT